MRTLTKTGATLLCIMALNGFTNAIEKNNHVNSKSNSSAYSVDGSTISAPAYEQKWKMHFVLGQNSINPSEYNMAIKKVSLGDVYGPVSCAGFGLAKNISKNRSLEAQLTANSQSKDAIKEDLAGNQIIYGKNTLMLINMDPSFVYAVPLSSSSSLELGIGPAFTIAHIESENEVEKKQSNTLIPGVKLSIAIEKAIKNYFIKLKAAYRTGKSENLDISAPEVSMNIGKKFGKSYQVYQTKLNKPTKK